MALHILDVIKYEGDNTTFVWKHDCEDFNVGSKLIVHETQQAVFFSNGKILEIFGPGRYVLDSENYFFIKDLKRTFVTGGVNAFHCEVYFINLTIQMAVKWGTDSKVRFIEPTLGVPVELGASGEMNLQVSDGVTLIKKLVGTTSGIRWEGEGTDFTKSLKDSFRPLISNAVRTHLVSAIKRNNIDIVDVDQHLGELSETLKNQIDPGFEEYGLTIPQFYLTTIVLPEQDPNFKRIRELHTIELQKRMAQAEAEVRTTQAQTKASYMTAEAEAEAQITAAKRGAILEGQLTETEIARREAERKIIQAQAEAQAAQMAGMAEAAVMQAKGYNQRDVLQAEVQKAYAEGIGNMAPAVSSGGGGSVMGDMLGFGVGMAAMSAMAPQVGEMMKGFNPMQNTPLAKSILGSDDALACPKCGAKLPLNAKFCLECGTKIEKLSPEEIICPSCGKKTAKGKFCMGCGAPLAAKCPKCGTELQPGAKFCPECGEKI